MIVLCTPSCSSLGNVQQSSPFFLQFPMCKCHHTFSGSSFTKLFSLALLYIYILNFQCLSCATCMLIKISIFNPCWPDAIDAHWEIVCQKFLLIFHSTNWGIFLFHGSFRCYVHLHFSMQWNAGRSFLSQQMNHRALLITQLPLYRLRHWFTPFLLHYRIWFTWYVYGDIQ